MAVGPVDLDEAPVDLRDGELLEQGLESRFQKRRRAAGLNRQIDRDPVRRPEREMRKPRARRCHRAGDLTADGSQLIGADASRRAPRPLKAQCAGAVDREDEHRRQVGLGRAVTERAADHPRLPLTAAVSARGRPIPGERRVKLDVTRLRRVPARRDGRDPKLCDLRRAHRADDPSQQRALGGCSTRDRRVDAGCGVTDAICAPPVGAAACRRRTRLSTSRGATAQAPRPTFASYVESSGLVQIDSISDDRPW